MLPCERKSFDSDGRGARNSKRHPLPLAHPHPGCKQELSTLLRSGTFYFALTGESPVGYIVSRRARPSSRVTRVNLCALSGGFFARLERTGQCLTCEVVNFD